MLFLEEIQHEIPQPARPAAGADAGPRKFAAVDHTIKCSNIYIQPAREFRPTDYVVCLFSSMEFTRWRRYWVTVPCLDESTRAGWPRQRPLLSAPREKSSRDPGNIGMDFGT